MNKGSRFAGFELVHVLLLVTAAELALNRLATRELRPHGEVTPPWWHQVLDHIGLFCQYFASTLAIGIIGYHLWRLWRQRAPYWSVPRWGLIVAGVPFLGLAFISLVSSPGEHVSFGLETAFLLMVIFLVLGQLTRGGDLGVRIGLAFLAVPLIVHYSGPLSMQFLDSDEARFSELPERIQLYGQWTMILAALVSPYCFAPRPFMQSAARLGPFVVATFVGVIGVIILRQHYEVGMRLAYHGLGIDIGPGAPSRFLALYVLALGTMTWTLTACFSADSISRRDIGVGLGLLVVGGYGFTWPLQYLVGLVGLVTIGEATTRVVHEEQADEEVKGFHAPPIADSVWQRYVSELAAALRGGAGDTAPDAQRDAAMPDTADASPDAVSETSTDTKDTNEQALPAPGGEPVVVTVKEDGERSVTRLVTRRHDVPVTIQVERQHEAIVTIEVVCGAMSEPGKEPDWTLYARPEGILGIGSHPEPPASSAPFRRIDDEPFEQRFRLRDAGGLTEKLLDEGMRARATALVDGWVAFWSGHGLCYRVHPGHGAPLDHPIPITGLAFRGASASPSVERFVSLLDLLAGMASRALQPGATAAD